MKSFLLLFFPLLVVGCSSARRVNPDPDHTHADYAVFINGEKADFSDEKYMSKFSTDEERKSNNEYVHLQDGVGSVIHRHKPGLTLADFFDSIGFRLSANCLKFDNNEIYCRNDEFSWRMFVNGEERDYDPNFVFEDEDRILLTYGATDEMVELQLKQMTDDACIYSHTCPGRGIAPVGIYFLRRMKWIAIPITIPISVKIVPSIA